MAISLFLIVRTIIRWGSVSKRYRFVFLIPNDVTIKLRVDNRFQVEEGTGEFGRYPAYEFEVSGVTSVIDQEGESALNDVSISPNPYSPERANTTLELQNLPSDCDITLYDLNGQMISSFSRSTSNDTSLNSMEISNHLPSSINKGVYFLSIEKGNSVRRTLKFVVL